MLPLHSIKDLVTQFKGVWLHGTRVVVNCGRAVAGAKSAPIGGVAIVRRSGDRAAQPERVLVVQHRRHRIHETRGGGSGASHRSGAFGRRGRDLSSAAHAPAVEHRADEAVAHQKLVAGKH